MKNKISEIVYMNSFQPRPHNVDIIVVEIIELIQKELEKLDNKTHAGYLTIYEKDLHKLLDIKL